MKIRFLGIGGAFLPELGSSAAVVETGANTCTLIDAGCSTYADLRRTGLIEKVTHIVITHLHDDHVGSLGSIINHRYHVSQSPVRLVFPSWLREPLLTLLRLQRTNNPVENYVELQQLNGDNHVGDTQVEAVDTSNRHQLNMPSSAYVFRSNDLTLAYSGDLGDPDVLFDNLPAPEKTRTIVLHDLSFDRNSSGSHAHYTQLHTHLDEGWDIRGYHNNPKAKPIDCRVPLVAEDPDLAPQRSA